MWKSLTAGVRGFWGLMAATAKSFMADEPFQLAAALSYFTMLSIAPLLLVLTGAAGVLLGAEQVQQEILLQAEGLVGEDGAELLATVMANAKDSSSGIVAMLTGFGLTLLGATTVFAQLQWALNRIFAAPAPSSSGALAFIKTRFTAFTVVLGLGFVLLVSLFLSAVLAGTEDMLTGWMPGADIVLQVVNLLVSLAVTSLFIALLFRYVPDRPLRGSPVWIGAVATAVLFSVGKYLIGLYLGQASVGSAYGAAGSAIVLMVWVYYASLILFIGAELTHVLAERAQQEPAPASAPTAPEPTGSPEPEATAATE